ncbi:MAG: type I secretion C-terminal target domain-containing protein [Kiloniellales bacterium]
MSGERLVTGPEDRPVEPAVLIFDAHSGDMGDRLLIASSGGIFSDGTVIARNNVKIGAIDPIDNGEDGAPLKIVLEPAAGREAIDALAAALRFESISDDPASGTVITTIEVFGTGFAGAEGAREIDIRVPVQPFEGLFGETLTEDILAEGFDAGPAHENAAGTKFLFQSEDLVESAQTGATNTVIHGFTLGEGGNVLDLGSVLKDGNYEGGSLEGYVELDDSSGTHTVLRVDIFGTGNFVDLAIIEGAIGLGSADNLLESGNLTV